MLLRFNKMRNSQTEVGGDVKGHSSMFMVQGLLRLLRCLCYSRSVTSPESFMIRSLGKVQSFCFSAGYEPFWVVIAVMRAFGTVQPPRSYAPPQGGQGYSPIYWAWHR